MANIVDQRAFFGVDTVKKVHEMWAEMLAHANEVRAREGLAPLELVDDRDVHEVHAYVNHSRWVADCPTCGAGMITWPDHPLACCLGCFHIARVRHPSKARIGEVEPILLERPDPHTRNWEHVTSPLSSRQDPKQLDRGRWAATDDEHDAGDGWESTRRIRNENRLIGQLPGDGVGDERDRIRTATSMGLRLEGDGSIARMPSTADVELPERD